MSTRRLRSSVSADEKTLEKLKRQKEVEEKLNRPFLTYSGKINYANTFIDCAIACDDLLNMVNNNSTENELMIFGFDMEWPFNFQTGPGKTALIQISPNLEICYLLQLTDVKSLPKGLHEFLHHDKVFITGVNIKNDVRKLSRDFPGFNAEKIIEKCIDTRYLANNVLPIRQCWSMEKLVDYVLKMKINKSNKIRMSKWHVVPLNDDQILYAAIDAFASLLLYEKLKKLETEAKKENIELIELL